MKTAPLTVINYYSSPIASAALDRAREFAEAAKAPATRRAYKSDMRDLAQFCRVHGANALPADPQTVALYASHLTERSKLATIRRRLVAISQAHAEHGLESPTRHDMVRRIVQGIARTIGAAQSKKDALTLAVLKNALLSMPGFNLKSARDRAILLLGFAAALRRSELAALNVEDLKFLERGLIIVIRRSKTDQIGVGYEVAVPIITPSALCAVTAVRTWLNAAGITSGPVFRSFALDRTLTAHRIGGRDVAKLVKRVTESAQIAGNFSAHSLRAGFVTSAAEAGVSLDNIARTTRHRSLQVLAGYI